jgi:hypothetical protein
MNTDIELTTGNWLLVMGPRAICPTLLMMIARLAEEEPVRVVDGGNHFNVYPLARAVGGRTEILERIQVSRAFSCHQMLATLESLSSEPVPFVVLDLLRTFYDQNVWAGERKRLLRLCLAHLDRLEKFAGGFVSVHPPRILCQTESELLEMVATAAKDTFHVETASPYLVPMRLC